MRKIYLYLLVMCAVLSLSGCSRGSDKQKQVIKDNLTTELNAVDELDEPIIYGEGAWRAGAVIGGTSIEFDDEDKKEIIAEINQLKRIFPDEEIYLYHDLDDIGISLRSGFDTISFTRVYSSRGYVIQDNRLNLYEDSEKLSQVVCEAIPSRDGDDSYVQDDEGNDTVYYSIACDEPTNAIEYRDAAVKCVDEWLSSMQDEATDDYYRNSYYELAEEHKNNYLACGYVNGRKEFVVEVCFNAKDTGNDTFYDAYYQEGRYTEAGTYWSGNYICGRFAYEDGSCSLIDICTRDSSEYFHRDLTGIVDGEYKTFYDFARREDLQELTDETFQYYMGDVVSKNLTMTSDGRLLNLNIYIRNGQADQNKNTIYGDAAFCTYLDGEMAYGTGVYFTDNETSTKWIEYPIDFKLVFDNYDGDPNPDYAVKYDEDQYGSYYVLESVQTDGRVFNLSGRAYEGGVYVAGCYEPSVRLQKTEDYAYVGWKYDEQTDKYIPTAYDREIELPDINMYSERLYLPENMKLYGAEENIVYCMVWNNTDETIELPVEYSIETFSNGEWTCISEGSLEDTIQIEPRCCAEVPFDISGIENRLKTKYRVVQSVGGTDVFGEFYMDGENVQNVMVGNTNPIMEGSLCGSLTINNLGSSNFEISDALLVNDDGSTDITLISSGYGGNVLESGKSEEIRFVCSEAKPLKAGEYEAYVGGQKCGKIEVVPHESEASTVNAEVTPEGEDIKLKLSFADGEDIRIEDIGIKQKQSGRWKKAYNMKSEDLPDTITAGESYNISFTRATAYIEGLEEILFIDYYVGEEYINALIKIR